MSTSSKPQMPTPTPCIGICTTVFGDQICRGCKRYMDEIIAWNGYGEEEKRAVDARLESHLLQILSAKIELFDERLFVDQLIDNRIRYMKNRQPLCWVNDLLRTNVIEESPFEDFGLRVRPGFESLSVAELRDQIDNELLALSQAHHERYINVQVQPVDTTKTDSWLI